MSTIHAASKHSGFFFFLPEDNIISMYNNTSLVYAAACFPAPPPKDNVK